MTISETVIALILICAVSAPAQMSSAKPGAVCAEHASGLCVVLPPCGNSPGEVSCAALQAQWKAEHRPYRGSIFRRFLTWLKN